MTVPEGRPSGSLQPSGPGALASGGRQRRLSVVGVIVGACAMLPPYVGPRLATAHRVEVADHLVPGLVVLAVSGIVLVATRRGPVPGTPMLLGGLVVVLAGLWMTSTHVPLVAQAARHEAPWGTTIYHCAMAVMVLTFGLVWTKASWADAEDGGTP